MKVLHLFSEYKLTGPSRLIVDLCAHLKVPLKINVRGAGESKLFSELSARGIPVTTELSLDKNSAVGWLSDAYKLSKMAERDQFNLIHCHHTNDLFISSVAKYMFGMSAGIVFSSYHRFPLRDTVTKCWLRKMTSAYITYSQAKLDDEIRYMGLRKDKCHVAMPGMTPPVLNDNVTRSSLGLADNEFIGVIVMRVQEHRRFDVVIDAVKEIVGTMPDLKILLLGRGTRIQELAIVPIEKGGLGSVLCPLGYKENYLDYLSVCDFFIYTSPGSDGTSRALREAMFLGKPSIVFDRYYVKDICDSDRSSILIKPYPSALAAALTVIHRNRQMRDEMGRNAASFAVENFDAEQYAGIIESVYDANI